MTIMKAIKRITKIEKARHPVSPMPTMTFFVFPILFQLYQRIPLKATIANEKKQG
jgi:hypothetical protein